jgi:hypothetical protein
MDLIIRVIQLVLITNSLLTIAPDSYNFDKINR